MNELSGAVVARRLSPANSLDFFPTPPWATRALVAHILREFVRSQADGPLSGRALDPCCGAGHMAIPLAEDFEQVLATDIHDWGYGSRRNLDFTFATPEDFAGPVDWVITNPPFALAYDIFRAALRVAPGGVIAMLLRLNWLEGVERYSLIFSGDFRPTYVCPFAERVPMIEGVWDPEADTATAYAWFVWDLANPVPRLTGVAHIPPGASARFGRLEDEALASRGEAARRAARRKAGDDDMAKSPLLLGEIPMDAASGQPGDFNVRFPARRELLIEKLRRMPKRSRQSIIVGEELAALTRAELELENRRVLPVRRQQEDEGAPLRWFQL